MRDQFVTKYLLEQKDAFFNNYSKALKFHDVDAVHDIRVSVKRLSTIIRMLNFNENANFRLKKCFAPVWFVYKQLGGIRDFQVLNDLLTDYQKKMEDNIQALIQNCDHRVLQKTKELQNVINLFKYHEIKRSFKLVEYYLSDKPTSFLSEKVLDYKKDRAKLIEFFSNKSDDKYDLHKVRKLVKDIGYLMEMSQNEMPDFASELKFYKELGSLLGTWHDRDVLINYLKRQQKTGRLISIDFERIITTISKEREELECRYLSVSF